MMGLKVFFTKFTYIGRGGKEMNPVLRRIRSWVQGYDHKKYWDRRAKVIDPNSKCSAIRKMYYLYWIKKVDARFGCSFGTLYGAGAQVITPPPFAAWAIRDYRGK